MYKAVDIASYFIDRGIVENISVTQMKLQKLIYFANGYVLATSKGKRNLLSEKFEAWEFGPVLPSIYQEFKYFGANSIIPENDILAFVGKGRTFKVSEKLEREDIDALQTIWEALKGLTASQLSFLTHRENSAWSKVYKTNGRSIPLNNEDIIEELNHYLKKED